MITLKKYANGRFYDTVNKQYVTKDELAQRIEKKEKIKIVLAKTGKDVTKSVAASLKPAPKAAKKKASPKKANGRGRWIARQLDKGLDNVLEMMNFPNRRQVVKLNQDVRKLADKVDDLHKRHAQVYAKMEQVHRKELENLTQEYEKAIQLAQAPAPAASTP